jgi:integrase
MYRHGVDVGFFDAKLLPLLFELGEIRRPDGPSHVVQLRPRLRVVGHQGGTHSLGPPAATPDEVAALVRVAPTARAACVVVFLAALGLRAGQLVGLLREDLHFLRPGERADGCFCTHGPHLHVVRREGHPRGAFSKSTRAHTVPVAPFVAQFYASWLRERRQRVPRAELAEWAFVSFPSPGRTTSGEPLSTRWVYELITGLATSAGLRHLHPHMLRHAFGSTAAELEVAPDVLQSLMGHASVESQNVYRSVGDERVAEAARRVGERLLGSLHGPT